MTAERLVKVSKFLSLVLRHRPERIGIRLDRAGWVEVDELLSRARAHGLPLTRAELEEVVATNDKRRFSFDAEGSRIRAVQGHSVEVELGYAPEVPPETLYHGTAAQLVDAIRREGLKRGQRHHVHLSADAATATRVGARRGRAVVLAVQAGRMQRDGLIFYRSANGVWLTEHVPPAYIVFNT